MRTTNHLALAMTLLLAAGPAWAMTGQTVRSATVTA